MFTLRSRAAAGVAVCLLAALAGCGKDDPSKAVAAVNGSNIQRVANLYAAHQNYMGGRGPRDEAEFKKFVKAFDPNKLSMMGVDSGNPEAVFVSERDGKPFKVRYNVGGGRGSVDAVAFEQEGQGGAKQVGFTGGKVEDVDDATYAQLWAGKGESQKGAAPAGAGKGGRPEGAPTGPPG